MKITDFLSTPMIIPELKARVKNAVLKEMADWMAAHEKSVNGEKLFQVLLAREQVSSTAIGEGVAIPHGKIPGVQRVSGVFARSLRGVDFDSVDGGPTYLFFLLIAPENSAADHLKALARISRLLKDPAFRGRLMEVKTQEEIFAAISKEDQKL